VATLLGALLTLVGDGSDIVHPCTARVSSEPFVARPFQGELQATWRERFGVQVLGSHSDGLTGTTCITSLPAAKSFDAPPGSCDRRNAIYDARIVDDNDVELPPGSVGEIVAHPLRPNVVFQGYCNNRKQRWRCHATSGSTRVISGCLTKMATSTSKTGRRTIYAVGGRTSPGMRWRPPRSATPTSRRSHLLLCPVG
jgi:acyl-CoA synthetase (AMP-forming)/AMP-acid ligase II